MRKLACTLILVLGCGPEMNDPPPMDGGVQDIGPIEAPCEPEVLAPEPVMPPAAIQWTCPAGWSEVERTCSPWPEGEALDCPQGEAHFPGTAGCEPIGTACPAGRFAQPPAEYASWSRIYVDRAATPGMDGQSESTPTSSFLGALQASQSATTPTLIMLSKGTYPVVPIVFLVTDTALWGACVRDTVIRTSTASTQTGPAIGAPDGFAGLGNLTIRANTFGAVVQGEGSVLDVQGVLIEEAMAVGIGAISGGLLSGERLVVRNVRRRLADAAGISFQEGGRGDLSSVIVADNENYGVSLEVDAASARFTNAHVARNPFGGFWVRGGTELELAGAAIDTNGSFGMHAEGGRIVGSDVIISDTQDYDDLSPGRGLIVSYDAFDMTTPGSVSLDGALLERNIRQGVYVVHEGSNLTLADTIIRDTAQRPIPDDDSDGGGLGILLTEGTSAILRRVQLDRNHYAGIALGDASTSLTATDLVVSATQPGLAIAHGSAVLVRRTATASITRALFAGNQGNGMEVTLGSSAFLDHVTIRDSAVVETSTGAAVGLLVASDGTEVRLTHGRLERNELTGISAQEGGRLEMHHVTVVGTKPRRFDNLHGMGFTVVDRGQVIGSAVAIEDCSGTGIAVSDGMLELTDLAVRRTKPSAVTLDGYLSGRGLDLENGTVAKLTNVVVEDNREVALFVQGAQVTLENAALLRTVPVEDQSGHGLMSQNGARVDLANVCVADNVEAGMIASTGEIYGHDVRVLRTKRNPCFDDGTCEPVGGLGILAVQGGYLALSTFEIAGNEQVGVTIVGSEPPLLLPAGEMDLINGIVSGSKLGADVRGPSFDISRITATVRYSDNEDNGVASGSTVLPNTDTRALY